MNLPLNTILQGDSLEVLKTLPDESVDTCITSPPYFGLRDYGVEGQIGLEETPEQYVIKLVEVFREVKRVLKDDGTLWLNLGDSYWANRSTNGQSYDDNEIERKRSGGQNHTILKPKDLIGIPWRVAFALQADGWYLRQDIIWAKPNPMPESVTDRCTKSHEYIFLLSKSPKYYFDNEAIKEKAIYGMAGEDNRPAGIVREREFEYDSKRNNNPEAFMVHKNMQEKGQQPHTMHKKRADKRAGMGRIAYGGKRNGEEGRGQESFVSIPEMRNKRSVWTINTKPYAEAHFATFPETLVAPMIKAGSPLNGVVLDIFMGSGTTALVAKNLGRNYLGVELNPDYIKIAEKRLRQGVML